MRVVAMMAAAVALLMVGVLLRDVLEAPTAAETPGHPVDTSSP